MSVCLSLGSDSLETNYYCKTCHCSVTTSKMRMHHMLVIYSHWPSFKVTQIFIMKIITSIISQTVQAIPIKFAVKIVRGKLNVIFSGADELGLHSKSHLRFKLDFSSTSWEGIIMLVWNVLFTTFFSSVMVDWAVKSFLLLIQNLFSGALIWWVTTSRGCF